MVLRRGLTPATANHNVKQQVRQAHKAHLPRGRPCVNSAFWAPTIKEGARRAFLVAGERRAPGCPAGGFLPWCPASNAYGQRTDEQPLKTEIYLSRDGGMTRSILFNVFLCSLVEFVLLLE
jgi:hypothetical protein